jgi:hypothetical protein
MTTPSKIKSFIENMKESEEQEQWGYEILLKHPDFVGYFDDLSQAGLFLPARSPGPKEAKEPGYFYVPTWSALGYLLACAQVANKNNDLSLGQKIMEVIRSVSKFRDSTDMPIQNYHTYREFARIMGCLPTSVVELADIDLLPQWLNVKFDHGMVCHALDEVVMPHLLDSNSHNDIEKAIRITSHCTELQAHSENNDRETIVEDYWLKLFIEHHAKTLGIKAGRESADLFTTRLREVFSPDDRSKWGYLFRPAIEAHQQNRDWHGPENRMVEGLRNCMYGWVEKNEASAKIYVGDLLKQDLSITRRVAIHLIDQYWMALKDIFVENFGANFFEPDLLHEAYLLLNHHFEDFNTDMKERVIVQIRSLNLTHDRDDGERLLRNFQRTWLSAIYNHGSDTADSWFEELNKDPALGQMSIHPSFISYMETSSGTGASPYSVQELIAYLESGSLIAKLNSFVQTDWWNGPSIRSLVDVLEETIAISPSLFIGKIDIFLNANRPYQYGLINGLKRLWEKSENQKGELDWDDAWKKIIGFISKVVLPDSFWLEAVGEDKDLTPTRNWIPSVVSDFLRSGTHNDAHAYSPMLLDEAWIILEKLLEKAELVKELSDDPMSQAINSEKGRAVEALYTHALRACRVSDKEKQSHENTWLKLQPIFDIELNDIRSFEFSTLTGSYVSNLEYLSIDWYRRNFKVIFPVDDSDRLACVLSGLAYAQTSRVTYSLLVEHGVLDRVFSGAHRSHKYIGRHIERVGLAYVMGDEPLGSDRFKYWFDAKDIDALKTVSHFLWSIRGDAITSEQEERIIAFWIRCNEFINSLSETPKELLSSLSLLACYVTKLDTDMESLMIAVAPYASFSYNTDFFFQELSRLVNIYPSQVFSILKKVLDSYEPDFDFENRLKSIIVTLAKSGYKLDAIELTNRLRKLSGMLDLYESLKIASEKIKVHE